MNGIIHVSSMSRERAGEIQKSGGNACFVYKGKIWCGPVISTQGDVRAKLDVPGLGKILVPYSKLDAEGESKFKAKSGEPVPQRRVWSTPMDDENYRRSNELDMPEIPASKLVPMENAVKHMATCLEGMESRREKFPSASAAELDMTFRENKRCVENESQSILDRLNDHYGIPANDIDISGKRVATGRGEKHGYYKVGSTKIRVYPYTGKLEKVVAPKTFLQTIVHEWSHHYDEKKLGLNSIHTAGFYKRVNTIYNQLKNVLETR